ncbi:hypothetical protein H8356DRAFT_951731 [Neocallimastix lanati (nom. inval.)]|uniref:CNH domain-containing protein n=1 Tax=Neocallimastix californiae TaxID=1754190 RepID=A0A1Y1YYM0_9FUNG|nr:hypothetical protein H8356DRAFT_951731 [Neocallimastix sp. JGI-2020a]ORY02964.1 hypothetical protein LY90DRAFT_519593 [Neocallimastix californiae]|eukprot:ORY02964.1 hypothetical protein LY90DRAFT_519593 [Neocallimastix californiae]
MISVRKYLKLFIIKDINIILSKSGKNNIISIHDITHIKNFKSLKNFENETRTKKLKVTKGCINFTVEKCENDIYICCLFSNSIHILKHDKKIDNKFLTIKNISINNIVNSLCIIHSKISSFPKLVICYHDKVDLCDISQTKNNNIFINLNKKKNHEIFESIIKEECGKLIRAINFKENILICYEKKGIIVSSSNLNKEIKTILWKQDIVEAGIIYDEYVVVCSRSIIDVFDINTGKIVHVFETKKESNRLLSLLITDPENLFVIANDKGTNICSLIRISLT